MHPSLELIPDEISRVFVAYSGGLDSQVLLHLMISSDRHYEVIPWHINHGLLEVAVRMEEFCAEQSRQYGLDIRIDRLELNQVTRNVEAEARRLRYQLFEGNSIAGDCVVTAHHADDQAETFLLNALRGSGSAGLRGIARQRRLGDALLVRPLLDCSRQQLEAYAEQHELSWFDDPSNMDSRYDRNYLRNEVIPLVRSRWPGYLGVLANTCSIQGETQDLLDEIAGHDYPDLCRQKSAGYDTLDLDKLLTLSLERRKNLLRYWISRAGLAAIPYKRMQELIKQISAATGSLPEIAMPDYAIRIYDRRLFVVRETGLPRCSGSFDFGLRDVIEIDQLALKLKRQALFEQLEIEDHGQQLSLQFRVEGEENDDRHRLKRLFQKYRVPPWQRSATAQVYLDGKLEGLLL